MIRGLLKQVGSLWGNQRDYLACDDCGHEVSFVENRATCGCCGGQIVAVVPNSELLALRWTTFKMRWFPYRTCELLPGGTLGPVEWTPPRRGPLRWLMQRRAADSQAGAEQ